MHWRICISCTLNCSKRELLVILVFVNVFSAENFCLLSKFIASDRDLPELLLSWLARSYVNVHVKWANWLGKMHVQFEICRWYFHDVFTCHILANLISVFRCRGLANCLLMWHVCRCRLLADCSLIWHVFRCRVLAARLLPPLPARRPDGLLRAGDGQRAAAWRRHWRQRSDAEPRQHWHLPGSMAHAVRHRLVLWR